MKGSITVFASLMIMLISQFVFTLLEAGRNIEMAKIAEMDSESGIESIFAQYCVPLWDEYRILAYDAGNPGEFNLDQIEDYIKAQNKSNFEITEGSLLSDSTSMLRLNLDEISIPDYTLLTDADGAAFQKQIVSYMKNNIAYEAAKKLYSDYSAMYNIEKESEYEEESVDDAIDIIKDDTSASADKSGTEYAKSVSLARCSPSKSISDESSDKKEKSIKLDEDNPLVSVSETKTKGILSLVLEDEKISSNTLDCTNCVSERTRNCGTYTAGEDGSWYDDILRNQYFLAYMSSYTDVKDSHSMKYELEYMICGKDDDSENLKGTITRILLIRCAANFAYLMTSPAKQSEALAAAATMAGFTVNPAIVEAVKYGLLAGWAYCESVLDLRTLMDGEKIPIIKSDETWTSGLSGISSLLSGRAKAKSSDIGLDYKGYIGGLLMFQSKSQELYRAMDLQEATVRGNSGYSEYRMDNSICSLDLDMKYSYNTIFLSFVSMIYSKPGRFELNERTGYAYY